MFKKNIFLIALFVSFIVGSASAEEEKAKPINITSDRLISDNKTNIISFIGNVKAVRDGLIIQSNKIEILRGESEKGVDMIVARGNVRINMKEKYATGDKAIYYEKKQKIVLTGNPKAWEGKNEMVGDQMVFFIEEDKLVVKQSKKKQVNIIFYPKEKEGMK